MGKKFVYDFSEGSRDMKLLLGGKGANLCEMTKLGIPVPSGFVISTEACIAYGKGGNKFPDGLDGEIASHLSQLEEKTEKTLGDPENPLLVSVRSGAMFSMPGMMDTVLNLGLNDSSINGLAARTDDERFAFDAYRRFIQMFGKVVNDVDGQKFEDAITARMEAAGVTFDNELNAGQLRELVEDFKNILEEGTGESFPEDPRQQLEMAIKA
ncbi:MAG: PEP/pyruvate-binding domain-containing protein, partial [Actinomycetota bacterium]